jgi:integrase
VTVTGLVPMMMKTTYGKRISELQIGQSAVLEKIASGGSVEARRLRSGAVMFYWRHTENTRTERIPIGHYDSSASPKSLKQSARGYSVLAAIEAARDLAKENQATPGGLSQARERERAAREAEAATSQARAKYTLEALCGTYVSWLERQGKSSSAEARLLFRNHLLTPYPDLALRTASTVSKREIVTAMRRLTEKGQMATARKLRSYLRAAYACALRADSDAVLPSAFVAFEIASNPVEATAPVKNQSAKNPLPAEDLRAYWAELQSEPGVIGAALRLHVLTGGQRPTQLARLRRQDVTIEAIRLLDPKGKRSEPRSHMLPITQPIREELSSLAPGAFLLSTDDGRTSMSPSSLTNWAAAVAARAGIAGFQLKRVRSGIETLLAQAGVPLHIRGQLQSHGVGGVQERHYDGHEYLPEKSKALATLHRLLQPSSA